MDKTNSNIVEGQQVKISKKTLVQSFTPEEELKYLVERGDWELVLTSASFLKRSDEGKAQVVREAIDNRIAQLAQTLNYLVNRGPAQRAAAMGVLQRKKELEAIRDEILKKIYERYPRSLTDKGGQKIYF